MVMRKKKIIVFFILFIFLTSLYLYPVSSATLQMPTPAVGDTWNYETMHYETTGNTIVKVEDRTIITVENETHDVFIISSIFSGTGSNNTSFHLNQTIYQRFSDGAIVKVIEHFNFSSDYYNLTYTYEYTYSPPADMLQYPIEVGEEWQTQYTRKETDLLDISNASESQINEYYICERIELVNATGKQFTCYVVNETISKDEPQNYTITWYSPSVGIGPVKAEFYQEGQLLNSLELKEYTIANTVETDEDREGKTPGFELFVAIVAIALFLFWRRKK